jgi:hypothetical protein
VINESSIFAHKLWTKDNGESISCQGPREPSIFLSLMGRIDIDALSAPIISKKIIINALFAKPKIRPLVCPEK